MCAHIYTNAIIAEENIFLKLVPTVFKHECFGLIDLLYSKDFIKKNWASDYWFSIEPCRTKYIL